VTGVVVRATLPRRERQSTGVAIDAVRRPAYVAQLLSLAHELRGLIERGEVSGVGELARRLGVSQPRITQIVHLTYLAPKIQAEILELEAVDGVEPMSERPLRRVLAEEDWGRQRRVFRLVVGAGR
jgi:hypothetical protein